MKYFWLIGYLIIALIYSVIVYLLSDYTLSDYSYWIRAIWCGVVLSLMYLSIGTFQRKASQQNMNAPLFMAFTMKMIVLGFVSVFVCIRSYFFHPDWMQVINLITQGCIAIYLTVLTINLIFISGLEKKSLLQIQKQRSYTRECSQLFSEVKNSITPNNIRLFNSASELFDKTILIVKTDTQILKINNIRNNLLMASAHSTDEEQCKIIQQLVVEINNFYR